MSDFVLYGYFRSSAAFRARIALNLKGIKRELRFIHLLKDGGQQHTAEYKTLNPQELIPALVHDGYTSFKVFMTYEGLALSDMEMLKVMTVARETGALVMVHAENYDAIRFLTDRLEQAGKTEPKYHAASRPIPVEREATHRAISLAELIDVPIMIVHVSNREAMEEIARARTRGRSDPASAPRRTVSFCPSRPRRDSAAENLPPAWSSRDRSSE